MYNFVGNSPVNYIDPLGLFPVMDPGTGGSYTYDEDGVTYDANGTPVDEAGLEAPNPFLDPINYAGGYGGAFYKNTYWMKNAVGFEIRFSKNLRCGWHRLPKGNYPGAGKNLPHLHRRPGIGKHRPWETTFKDIRDWWKNL